MSTEKTVQELAQLLGDKLIQTGSSIATAESCTGGGVAYAITEISGSSQWFDRSFVTYSNDAKMQMLKVDHHLIDTFGAVSEQVVEAMSSAAILFSNANISVAISGIAGPNGGSDEKPVGTVCFSWCRLNNEQNNYLKTKTYHFHGDRKEVRIQAIKIALNGLIDII